MKSTHLVVSVSIANKVHVLVEGTRYQCQKYIRARVKQNMPTHFCHIIGSSDRAMRMFKNRIGI